MVSSNSIANSSLQPWLDFNGTLPAHIPPCQQRANNNGLTNSTNVTVQSCKNICNNATTLLDPLSPNNLLTCGLWASLVWSEVSPRPDMENKDLVPFITLGLDYKDVTYAKDVQNEIGGLFSAISIIVKAGTSGIDGKIPGECTSFTIFEENSSVSRYATPNLRINRP